MSPDRRAAKPISDRLTSDSRPIVSCGVPASRGILPGAQLIHPYLWADCIVSACSLAPSYTVGASCCLATLEKADLRRSALCEDLQVRKILVEAVTVEQDSNFLGTIYSVARISRSHERSRLYVAAG